MKLLGKLVFCLAAGAVAIPVFAFDPPPGGPPGHDRRDDRHDNRHDDRRDWDHDRDWHDDRGPHRGPPPHARWERGHRYDGRVVVIERYHDYRLREPPRGYHWVRDDDGDFLLIAIATGIIADIVSQ